MFKSQTLVSVDMILFGNRVFADVTMITGGHIKLEWPPNMTSNMTGTLRKVEKKHTNTQRKNAIWQQRQRSELCRTKTSSDKVSSYHQKLVLWIKLYGPCLSSSSAEALSLGGGRLFSHLSLSWWITKLKLRWAQFSSVQFSHSVVSYSLQPHELQHARPPCPSPTPGVYPNPCPLSQWCHPTHPLLCPSPPALNLSQHQGIFKWVNSWHEVAKVLEFQL